MNRSIVFVLLFFSAFGGHATGLTLQDTVPPRLSFLQHADTLNKARFWTCALGGAAIYGGFSVGLYQAWYKNYDLVGFHTFNDLGEWNGMDKSGHFITAYTETRLVFNGARWTGMQRRPALWTGVFVGSFLQATVEVMDGFSAKWGFSWSDVGFNTLGVGLFAAQELGWQDQRIVAKISYTQPHYTQDHAYTLDGPADVTLQQRATDLYGHSFAESFLKDYNALTIWASVNPYSFAAARNPNTWIPPWLNIAVGYGSENLYGGFDNTWEEEDTGVMYYVDEKGYPRYRQFFLSLDVDLTRIPTRSRLLKSIFHTLNWIKIPAPALEVNTLGNVRFHPFYW